MWARKVIRSSSISVIAATKKRCYHHVSLVGVPFSGGQTKAGVEEGPKALRAGGIVEAIEALGRKVDDYGDIERPEYSKTDPELVEVEGHVLKNSRVCGAVSKQVADLVEKGARDDKICVTIGGDHSIATGTLIGHQRVRENLCVVWVDAHNDLNTYRTTETGNLHGMCLSFVLKNLPDATKVPGYEWTKPCLTPFDLVYIGLRDTDPGEYQMTHDLGILTFSMHEVDRYGISTVLERAIESINPRLDRPMHVSYDVDSLDPLHSPGTGTAVMGGLSLREGLYIGEYINKLGLLAGLDIVEVNPSLDCHRDPRLTVSTAIRLTEACLGKHRSGYIAKRKFDFQ